MARVEHGISVGMYRINEKSYMIMKAIGKLTHEDYELVMPIFENTIKGIKDPSINAIIDITEFSGWEIRAAWDDLKMGMINLPKFSKVAVVGNRKWEEIATKVANWFTNGEMKYFEDYTGAREWFDVWVCGHTPFTQ